MLILLFISLCSLNLNKLSRIKPVHQVFVLDDISHLNQDRSYIVSSFTILLFLIETSKTKTVEKFGEDSPTVFIYRFSGIPASSYPRCSIKRSSENVSQSIECSNARSMDTRQSLKAFYASIRYSDPVVHSSLQHCKLYVFIQLTAQNYGFS